MTNLRLLFVLIVLASVCWEANCWMGYTHPKVCSSHPQTLSCPEGQVFRVGGATYKKNKGFFNYKPWSGCMMNLRKELEENCKAQQSCHVDVDKMAENSKGCKKQDFCLLLILQCQ